MDAPALEELLADVASGACTVDDAVRRLRRLPFVDLGFARIDHHRALRQHIPEAVYGPGKTPEQCARIVVELLGEPGGPVLLTRASPDQVKAAAAAADAAGFSSPTVTDSGLYATVTWRPAPVRAGRVLVLTGGTADRPVADECRAVLEAMGFRPSLLADCGVAGLHRLLASVDELLDVDALVVVAGRGGAR